MNQFKWVTRSRIGHVIIGCVAYGKRCVIYPGSLFFSTTHTNSAKKISQNAPRKTLFVPSPGMDITTRTLAKWRRYQYCDHKWHIVFIHLFPFHSDWIYKIVFSIIYVDLFISSTPRNSSNLLSLWPSNTTYQ